MLDAKDRGYVSGLRRARLRIRGSPSGHPCGPTTPALASGLLAPAERPHRATMACVTDVLDVEIMTDSSGPIIPDESISSTRAPQGGLLSLTEANGQAAPIRQMRRR